MQNPTQKDLSELFFKKASYRFKISTCLLSSSNKVRFIWKEKWTNDRHLIFSSTYSEKKKVHKRTKKSILVLQTKSQIFVMEEKEKMKKESIFFPNGRRKN